MTTAYSLVGLLLLLLATAGLYIVLRIELDRSTDLFLADKLHVLRTLLLERLVCERSTRCAAVQG